jgi:integrase
VPRGACVIKYDGKRGIVWRIQYVDSSGRQQKETIGAERDGVTRKHAEAELRERLVRVEQRGWQRPRPLTFEQYAETWFTEGTTRRAWKPGTVLKYRKVKAHLCAHFGLLPLASIRPRDVAGYTREALETFAPKTVQLHLNVLHNVFKTARAEELVESNPVEGAERPKVRRRRWRILQPVEVERIAREFEEPQARAIFMTLILTGMRRFELWNLRWREVDFVDSIVRIVESKSDEGIRSIALSPTLAEELWQHRRRSDFKGDDELVFVSATGKRIDHEKFAAEFRAALTRAGIDDYLRPFHDLRHASLTNGAAGGEGALELMTRAGHRSMATTKQYLHLAGTTFPDAARALDDRLFGGATLYPSGVTEEERA